LKHLLEQLDFLDRQVAEYEARIAASMDGHRDLLARLCTIPTVDLITAWTLLAEIGTDMSRFPTAAHLCSWAGLCPGNNESAGKRFSGKTRKGDRYLRRTLVQNAWAASHMKKGLLKQMFFGVARRRGMPKAAVAVAHRILQIAYFVIRDGTMYREVGVEMDERKRQRTAKRLARRLEEMGYEVTVKPCARPSVAGPRTPSAPGPLPGQTCKMCNAWGRACIHARNAVKTPPPTPST